MTYTYPAAGSARPHAVTSTSNGGSFSYDNNGNMTSRRDKTGDPTYTQAWDYENRLASVTVDGKVTTLTCDANGNLVKEVGYDNLAAGIQATCDVTLNWPGVVTNEDTWADSGSGSSGEFAYTAVTGLHYVQVDLGAAYTVDKVRVWHYAGDGRTYHNTKTQVSANGTTWVTVFDSAVSGEYAETAGGKTHTFSPQSVRYVRDYLNGSTSNTGNHWVEIEVWGTRTRVQVGDHYEKNLNSGVVTKYYQFGGSQVAMRRGSAVQYLLSDHLRSTSLMVDSSGSKVAELRYRAFGETRYSGTPNGMSTDLRFTGQHQDGGIKLYAMGARHYDPELGRWISPDPIIPDLANPQSLNRLAYVYNNPLGYIDFSGHAGQPWWKRLVNKIVDYWAPWTAPAITGPRVSPRTSDGMTSWLVSQMNTNAQAEVTQLIRENWVHAWPHQNAAALKAWTSLVRAGAVWDFKTDILYYDPDIENVQLGGHELNYQAVANIHFGFVGRAAGFGSEVLRAGAGIAQFMDWYNKDPSAIGPLGYETENGVLRTYFDQPFDAWCVVFGIYLYEMYRDELTEEIFEQALQEFIEICGEPPPLE